MTSYRIRRILGAATSLPRFLARTALTQKPVIYETHGSGPVLFLGYPITIGPVGDSSLLKRYVDRLSDSYRVVVMDYPPTGRDARIVSDRFTPDYVCADILAVADAIGANSFAWYGYSWGGLVGLQLAARTDRLTALICGGFPPFGASYRDIAAATKAAEPNLGAVGPLMATFFRALEEWNDRETVAKFNCPRMTFAGGDDVVVSGSAPAIRIGPLVAEHHAQLEAMGWTVRLLNGYRHDLFMDPDVVVPLLRNFLDPILLQK